MKNLRNKNESGGICSNAAFVAGKVAPQMRVVSRRASRGMNEKVLSPECLA